MTKSVLIERRSNGVIITLNRPDQLNAFDEAQHLEFRDNLKAARDDHDVRVILITGAGRGFCAGQDLGKRDPSKMTGPPDLGETIENFYNPLIRLIRSIPKPVICAVNGVAAGAGANIAFACDIVLAAKSAKFIQAFCKLGLVPDSGGSWILPRLIGEARAKGLMMTGVPILAEQAQEWGMIWKCFDDEDLMEEAHKMMDEFSNAPTFGLGLMKQTLHAGSENNLDQQLDFERDQQRRAGRSKDYAIGVTAFLKKKKPDYSGRE